MAAASVTGQQRLTRQHKRQPRARRWNSARSNAMKASIMAR